MGCACGKGRTARTAKVQQFVYDYTAPGTTEATTFGTPLEAKRAVRRNGGGTIKRRPVPDKTVAA